MSSRLEALCALFARARPMIPLCGPINWRSPTLLGPFRVIGDCLSDEETLMLAWADTALPIRSGDVGIWHLPTREPGPEPPAGAAWVPQGEQEATKWLVTVNGLDWLANKFFAVKRDPTYHVPFARVIALKSFPGLPLEHPEEWRRLKEEALELRANPPQRPDLIVFPHDLLSPAAVKAAILAAAHEDAAAARASA